MLLARTPLHAPAFEQLTQYDCAPPTPLPSYSFWGPQRVRAAARVNVKCRTQNQAIDQRLAVIDGSNPAGWQACIRERGIIRIWRIAPPSPYGAYVFHSTCGEHVTMYYPNRVAKYEATQQFIIALASLLILTSTLALALKFKAFRRANSNSGE
jgi:hypothetical protein